MTNKEFVFHDQKELREEGAALGIKITNTFESIKSKFQEIQVYQTQNLGKMLILDGVIMLTESDEFCYHEMISHVALNTHPNPKKVLVIGGGDGGTVREILKHDTIEQVHLCEIDKAVIDVCKKHLPLTASQLDNPKVKIFYEDGAKFVKENKGYDIIIIDSSDPVGPATILFEKEFFQNVHNALNEDGIMVSQAESFFNYKDIIEKVFGILKNMYPITRYYYTLVPTYSTGKIGFMFASKKHDPLAIKEIKPIPGLKYYNKDIHKAAFILPEFTKEFFP